MSKFRKYALITALLAVLCVNGAASASPRSSNSPTEGASALLTKLIARVVHILDDLRGSFPPG